MTGPLATCTSCLRGRHRPWCTAPVDCACCGSAGILRRIAREGGSGPQVCRAVGITYRQLDYWARTELVVPTLASAGGSGTRRRYSANDVLRLRLVKSLLDLGLSLLTARRVLPLVVGDATGWLVLVDNDVRLVSSVDELVSVIRGGACTVVDLDGLRSEVTAA